MKPPLSLDQQEFLAALEAAGYDYGDDAAENAYVGWCLARETSTHVDPRITRAVLSHDDGRWPRELTSGVMYFEGLRITLSQFLAAGGNT
jgi:hypothetical protein